MISLLTLQKKASEAFPGRVITGSHLLFVWGNEDDKELRSLLEESGFDTKRLQQAVKPLMDEPAQEDRQLVSACIHSVSEGSVTGWHLLSIICDQPTHRITKALVNAGLNLEKLRKALDARAPKTSLDALLTKASKTSTLLKWGRDLTEEAATGTFDDLCDRPKQMENLLLILQRKQKANPVLTGHAGVGKTALVELLARNLANDEVPKKLSGTRLFELSMSRLLAGTKYRGEFEQRFEEVMKALRKAEPAILFIDEFHLVWGAGRAEGAPMDAANMLKPLLGRGTLRVIGATTSEEYHRYITRDPALARRFDELRLEEPDEALLLEMVKKQTEGLEVHHGIAIPDSIIPRAIELTNLHLPNHHQPDKTINLLDKSAVRAANRGAAELSEDDLLHTLEAQTGRSLAKLDDSERLSLLDLGQKLKQKIIGQDEAIEKVASTLIYRRQQLGETTRNLGSFLFVGSTGVGKTELARSLATALFGSQDYLLHMDMSEYRSYGATQKLIGFSPMFVGNDEGILSSWLYARGTGVLLFDEIEKASKEIHYLLLGMLDRGRIRDARGEELDTRQCVVVLTSNALKPDELKRDPLGFSSAGEKKHPDVTQLLATSFPHEFLGRLDEIVLFNDLERDVLKRILKMRLEEGLARFQKDSITVDYDEDRLLEHLCQGLEKADDSGARGIHRLLERMLLQPLAMALAGYRGQRPAAVTLRDAFYDTGQVNIVPAQEADQKSQSKSRTTGNRVKR